MRILRTPGCSYSKDKGLVLKAPRSWRELTQDQLWYVFFLLTNFNSLDEVKTMMFLRFCGLKTVRQTATGAWCRLQGEGKRTAFHLESWQIESLIGQFDYIDTYEDMGVRLESVRGFHAVDVMLRNIPFIDWLNMERLYQQYLKTQDPQRLDDLARLLYRDGEGNQATFTPDDTERTATFAWFSYIKSLYARMFPHFFKPAAGSQTKEPGYLQMANAQIRALTDGDVTKEAQVQQTDCLRALTELNEKAREAEEFRKKYSK